MKRSRSTYALWAIVAVLVVGFYSIELQPNQASVFSVPSFSADEETEIVKNKSTPSLQEFNDAIVEVAEEAKSTVVTVTVTQTVQARPNPLSRFFGDPRDQQPKRYEREGQGSGVIVSKDGYILTNNHVVENADEVEVQLYNDKVYNAKVVGTDPQTDIAVLKVKAEDLNVIKLGNSEKARVGEMVLAIGSPLNNGLAHSVSMGIVSAKDRSIGIIERGAGYENFIQTDAAINPGNSGGALVNMEGELIGVNTAIASRSGGSDGIGFAVPVDIAKRVMKSIIEKGRVVRGYLGITTGGEVDDTMARALGLNKSYGIIVGAVKDDGPADKAGLQEDDIIQTLNDKPVRNWNSLRTTIATSSPGTEVELGIIRDEEKMTLTVTLGELPEDLMTDNNQSRPDVDLEEQLGFSVTNLSPEIAQELGVSRNQDGVVVTQISRRSDAYQQGLRQGYIITEVNREPVANLSEFNEAMNKLMEQKKDIVLLRVKTKNVNQLIAFEL
ncbi:Do family serine endopeptidase [Fodinibius saliphilus]|uniref:Do family serine endopeptidase n=1 Tax=Fodinibius saliphilus TaxID=1920650 RepID=UPI001107F04B|nr:Do family serine endopeptidase [Fodinibius saliphilus]